MCPIQGHGQGVSLLQGVFKSTVEREIGPKKRRGVRGDVQVRESEVGKQSKKGKVWRRTGQGAGKKMESYGIKRISSRD